MTFNNYRMRVGYGFAITISLTMLAGHAMDFLQNGSFASPGAGDRAAHWLPVYGGYTLVSAPALEGSASLAIGGTGENGRAGALQRIRGFAPGATLTFTAHVFIETFDSGIIKPIHIGFRSQGRMHYRHINLIHGRGGEKEPRNRWLRFAKTVDFTDFPDVDEIAVYCLTWNLGDEPFVGRVFFDGLSTTSSGP